MIVSGRVVTVSVAAAVLICCNSLLAPPARATGAVAASWHFAGIGASQRTLRLLVDRGPCGAGATQNVNEGPDQVRIDFLEGSPPSSGCSAPQFHTVFIVLKAPLRGRSLVGSLGRGDRLPKPAKVPRVIGLKPGDAITALHDFGYPATIVSRRIAADHPRVLAQLGTRLVVSR